jgi:hypothetical protein
MPKIKGKLADFAIGTVDQTASIPALPYTYGGSNMTRIETTSNECSITIEAVTVDSGVYGDDFDQFEIMTYSWSIELAVMLQDTAPDTELIFIQQLLDLGKYKFVISPNGKPAGEATPIEPAYSGIVVISSVGINPVRTGTINLRIRLQGDGELRRVTA